MRQTLGSVRPRGDRYQVRYRAAGKETSKSFCSRAAAEEYSRELAALSAQHREALAWGQELTFAEIARMRVRSTPLAEETLRTEESHLRNHIGPVFGDTQVGAIRRIHVDGWLRELDLAPATKQRILGVIRAVCGFAHERGFIGEDPTRSVKVPGSHRRSKRTLPTVDAVESLVQAIDPRYSAAIDLLAYGGARVSEMAALQVGDLDFPNETLSVRRTLKLQAGGSRALSSHMKTVTADRVVPTLPRQVWERLARFEGQPPCTQIVCSPRGALLDTDNFRRRVFAPAVASLEAVPESVTPHVLRHFAISLWLAAGFGDYDAADWAGHTDASQVRQIYGQGVPRTGSDLEEGTLASIRQQHCRPRSR